MNLYIVTGTTKGLGAALRNALASDANNVVICLSRADAVNVPGQPANVFADLSDIDSIAGIFAVCESLIAGKKFDRAILLNNAGVVGPVGKFNQIDPTETARNISVNLVAPMVLTRLFANATRALSAQRLVVNISSGAAKRAISGWSAYCASKAGMEMATRAAAAEAAVDDPSLAICSLAPGVVDTPMQAQVRSVSEQQFPDVERFRAMKNEGALRDANAVANDIIRLVENGKLTNGGNFDIREMTA
ncbi:MAG: SDR family NAD(P)-dependent oxidoreductase [Betaproteobacteria bacterium]